MGVQGLWELLAPVGRRVSVEALSGRKLAIDASIWIIQFMKAMRDEKGDMIRNAHILGFFRRICKLLYLRAKPVFVFDGGTPALKRRTVIARRRQRERAQSKIRKTAEKLLLNHLRTRKLDEIAQNIGLAQSAKKQENVNIELVQSRKKQGKAVRSKGNKEGESNEVSEIQGSSEQQPPLVLPEQEPSTTNDNGKWTTPSVSEVDGDLMLSDGGEVDNASDDSDDGNEEYFMPPMQGRIDPAVLASLPPSMQLNLLVQMREQLVTDNRKKFQKVAKNPASFSQMQIQAYLKTVAFRRDINQVQKAAAGKGIGGIPSARIASEVDREYIFSTTFEPEQQATEADKGNTQDTSLIYQDNVHALGNKQSQERLSERVDIDQSVAMAERISLQKSSPKENSLRDKDIEWEDGDEVVSLTSQPVKGAVITIEIDQNDLLAEGIEVEKLCPDVGLEDEDIEWEDEPIDCIERQDAPISNGDHMVDSDTGTGFLAANGMSADSPEIVDKTLMEIEAAELEEAIRQSLEDHADRKAPKLVIRDESTIESKQNELPPPVNEALSSEDAFLARERERKGKAIVDDYQAVRLGNRATGEGGTLTLKVNDLEQVSGLDSRYAESCKPSISESENALPSTGHMFHVCDGTSQAHANDITTNSLHSESCKLSKDIGTPSEGHTSVICDGTFHAKNHIANVAKSEGEYVENLNANIPKSVAVLNELKVNTEQSSFSPSFLNSERLGEEMISSQEKLRADRGVLTSVDKNDEGVDANTDVVMEREKPSTLAGNYAGASVIGHYTAAEDDHLQEALLKEAEEVDLNAEREAFAKQERSLLAEREELSRQQAELQAEMEAEQAAMQADLQEERDLLLQEEMELRATQRKNERNAESVTGEMFSECQELLQMFGLPYIIAPMEAEAQCAYMDSIGLVDGVVTEDCDVFLFGGRNVFKNIFDDRKYVETYYMKDVESELGLDQEKLIHMALLLGSDYTEGISGIGIVNAIEVVNAFEGEAGLQKFKDWLDAPDLTLLDKIHHDCQKKQTKKNRIERESEAEDHNSAEELDDSAKEGSQTAKYNNRQQDFMHKHRAVSKNWNVPENFPNPVVINAYISPQVDKSTESFTWGRPDLEALRRACLERFGWNKSKSDELLLPVLKEYDRHETQLRLEAFYTFNQRFAKIRSKRIQKAVSRGTGRRLSSELVDFPKADDSEESSPTRRKAKDSKHTHDAFGEPEPAITASSKKTAALKRRKRKAIQGEEVSQEVATRGRGRGRGRGASSRGRATASKKRSDPRLSTEASLSDENSSEEFLDLDDKETTDGVHVTVPRRSSRLPERMVYNFSGSEDDSDSGVGALLEAGGSPGHAVSILPLEVKKSDVSVAEESNLSKDGEEIGEASSVDVIGHQYGFQGEKDEDYLFMGGGFCTADDDVNQEQSRTPLEVIKDDVPEGSARPDTLFVGSDGLKAEFSNSETADHVSGVEPRLHAVPFLRRKKRRAS